MFSKIEKILKGSLDSVPPPSPSVKIQIMGGKIRLRFKSKTLLQEGKARQAEVKRQSRKARQEGKARKNNIDWPFMLLYT